MARARTQPASQQEFKCPECGRTFTRAAALGAHRRQAHGVVGTSSSARAAGRRSRPATTAGTPATGKSVASKRRSNRSSNGGARKSASTAGRRRTGSPTDRDALLKALFPNGIPPREDVIRAVNGWLDDAERLARMT
jgi:Zinc finger, C2H2 type